MGQFLLMYTFVFIFLLTPLISIFSQTTATTTQDATTSNLVLERFMKPRYVVGFGGGIGTINNSPAPFVPAGYATNFGIHCVVDIPWNERLTLRTGTFLTAKGFSAKEYENQYIFTSFVLEIPLILRFMESLNLDQYKENDQYFRRYVLGGIATSFQLAQQVTLTGSSGALSREGIFRENDFTLIFGVGFEWWLQGGADVATIDIQYLLGLTDVNAFGTSDDLPINAVVREWKFRRILLNLYITLPTE